MAGTIPPGQVLSGEGGRWAPGELCTAPWAGVLPAVHGAPWRLSLSEMFGEIVRGGSSTSQCPPVRCPGQGALLIGRDGLEVIAAAPPLPSPRVCTGVTLRSTRNPIPLEKPHIKAGQAFDVQRPGRAGGRRLSALFVICGPAGIGWGGGEGLRRAVALAGWGIVLSRRPGVTGFWGAGPQALTCCCSG